MKYLSRPLLRVSLQLTLSHQHVAISKPWSRWNSLVRCWWKMHNKGSNRNGEAKAKNPHSAKTSSGDGAFSAEVLSANNAGVTVASINRLCYLWRPIKTKKNGGEFGEHTDNTPRATESRTMSELATITSRRDVVVRRTKNDPVERSQTGMVGLEKTARRLEKHWDMIRFPSYGSWMNLWSTYYLLEHMASSDHKRNEIFYHHERANLDGKEMVTVVPLTFRHLTPRRSSQSHSQGSTLCPPNFAVANLLYLSRHSVPMSMAF